MGFNIKNNYGPNIEVNDGGKVTLVQGQKGLWHTSDAEEAEYEDSDVDFIDAMKMIKQTGGGKLAYTCPAGQSVMCEFAWDLKEIYDYAPMGCLFPIALPELAGENVDFSWLGIFGPSAVEMEPENVIVSLDAELPEKVGFTFAVGTADMVVRQNEYYSGRAELSELEKEVKKIVHLEFRPE